MAMQSNQLDMWSHQGGTVISSTAYASIRYALTKASSPLHGRGVEIFLQGSYANATNTYGDSDIDVVVLYKNTFYKDMSSLSLPQQQAHEHAFGTSIYQWSDLRRDVLSALTAHFGAGNVAVGNKAIKVKTGAGRMTADVVPAVQFRRYATFVDAGNLSAHWGIHFFDAQGNGITNYPKYHIDRGQDKNRDERTRGLYKPVVRLFKNFRSYMVDNRILADGVAPSYYIECVLHNVPDNLFGGVFSDTVPQILDYLWTTPIGGLVSQNGVVPLIGTGPTQWPEENLVTFVSAARDTFSRR
jgi:Nucleotidyltransferase domain